MAEVKSGKEHFKILLEWDINCPPDSIVLLTYFGITYILHQYKCDLIIDIVLWQANTYSFFLLSVYINGFVNTMHAAL